MLCRGHIRENRSFGGPPYSCLNSAFFQMPHQGFVEITCFYGVWRAKLVRDCIKKGAPRTEPLYIVVGWNRFPRGLDPRTKRAGFGFECVD